MITTLTHVGLEGQLFRDEAASGVRQSAEAVARMTLDLLWHLAPLSPLFVIPISALASMPSLERLSITYWCCKRGSTLSHRRVLSSVPFSYHATPTTLSASPSVAS